MADMQQFSSAPQAVGSRKAKYRDPDEGNKRNIMHDSRVVRGNTYASVVQPQPDNQEAQTQRDAQRRRLMRANQTRKRAGTPEPVPGRRHMDIQTDSYLEELTERVVEFEAETQTDFLFDRPPSPLFLPAKIGVDAETHIEDGELFDFDVEVEPVLEVLVGKTLEQSMMEVLEEEELESLRKHQEDFEKRRNAALLEVQRMEAQERRRADEMERRKQQQEEQRKLDLSMMRKVVARSVAAAHLSSLRDRAMAHLQDAGFFADGVQLAVESKFVPTLLQMVMKQMEVGVRNSATVGSAVQSTVSLALKKQSAALDKERSRILEQDEAEQQRRDDRAREEQRRASEAARIKKEREAYPWHQQVLRLLGGMASGEKRWLVPGEESTRLQASGELAAVAEGSLPVRCIKAVDVGKGWYRLRVEKFNKGVFEGKVGEFLVGLEADGDNRCFDAAKTDESQAVVVRFRASAVAPESVDAAEAVAEESAAANPEQPVAPESSDAAEAVAEVSSAANAEPAAPESLDAGEAVAEESATANPEPLSSGSFFMQVKADGLPEDGSFFLGLVNGDEPDTMPRAMAVPFAEATALNVVVLSKDDCSEGFDELKEKLEA